VAEHGRRPDGTPESNCGIALSTLKRGAKNHCAYGAGDGLLPAWSASTQAPSRGDQPYILRRCGWIFTQLQTLVHRDSPLICWLAHLAKRKLTRGIQSNKRQARANL